MTVEEIRRWLIEGLAAELDLAQHEIKGDQPFAELGLSSEGALKLSGALQTWLGVELPPSIVYDHPTIESLARRLGEGRGVAEPVAPIPAQKNEPIAIVGIGCRFPGSSPGPSAFFDFLMRSGNGVSEVPADRWDRDRYFSADPDEPGKTCTRWGGFVDHLDAFDASLFGISPVEATQMDPQQRVLLETAWHALEDAGYDVSELAGSALGVFVGISTNEYAKRHGGSPTRLAATTAAGTALSIAANRLSYFLDARGPSVAVDTACSSSLTAVHLACQALRANEASLAVAGGVNAILSPDVSIAFTRAGLMSPSGRCKAFSADADGYVRGEGAGLVVLKRLSDARRDGNQIYAVILGGAVVQDGRSNGLMAPRGSAQEQVITAACQIAGVSPMDLDYVEAHGTGTSVGDVLEANAIGAVLAARKPPDRPTLVGSVKSNIGHLESAAGVAGLIKAALSVWHGQIPPSLNADPPNPAIDFARLGLEVVTTARRWPDSPRRLAGVSSFGFGGTNVHLVIAQADDDPVQREHPDQPLILGLSAASPDQLHELAQQVHARMMDPSVPDTAVHQLTKSLARRRGHRHRLALTADRREVLERQLGALMTGPSRQIRSGEIGTGGVAFVYSGQGAIWPGVGRDLFESDKTYRAGLVECDRALQPFLGSSILPSLFGEQAARDLERTEIAQPALFAVQVALTGLLRRWGVSPAAYLGHSAGEIAAALAAGALDLTDAAHLVVLRGRAMADARGKGRMATVRASQRQIQDWLNELGLALNISAVNGPESIVVSGPPADIEALVAHAGHSQRASLILPVDYAFHSPQMDDAAIALEAQLANFPARAPRSGFYSGVDGGQTDRVLDAAYWRRNLREPVLFADAVSAMAADRVDVFIEIGPNGVLARDLQAILRNDYPKAVVAKTLTKRAGGPSSLADTAGALFASGALHSLRAVLEAPHVLEGPTYPMARTRYWLDEDWGIADDIRGFLGARRPLAFDPMQSIQDGIIDLRRSPFLADHRVLGNPVVPAAAIIDIFLAAALTALGGRPISLENVEFLAPILLGETPLPLQVATAESSTGDVAVSLYADHGGVGEPAWQLHARATARTVAPVTLDRISVDDVLSRCFDRIPGPMLYDLLAKQGLDYGPQFRGLAEVFARRGEALGRLGGRTRSNEHAAHPALLDSALHVLAPAIGVKELLDADDDSLFLPQSIARVTVHGDSATASWTHCNLTERGKTSVTADLVVADEEGRPLMEIAGLQLAGSRKEITRRRETSRALSDWLYGVNWTPAPTLKPGNHIQTGLTVVLTNGRALGDQLVEALTAGGRRCVQVRSSTRFAQIGADIFDADLTKVSDLRRVLNACSREDLKDVVHLAAVDLRLGESDPALAVELGPTSLAGLVQAIETSTAVGRPRLTVATQGAQSVKPGEAGDPLQSLVWGLSRAIVFEHPNLGARRIDLDPIGSASDAAFQLADEILRADEESQIAYRDGQRFAARLARRSARSRLTARIRPDASYLITGGWGALGLTAANTLLRAGAASVVLVGRNQPSHQAQVVIDAWRANGKDIRLHACDIADLDQVRNLVESFPSGPGRLAGVIHAAGLLDDCAIMNLSPERFRGVLSPKLLGGLWLHETTSSLELDFFVMYSSAVSLLGAPGQGNYCSANAFLDALAIHRAHSNLPALSIGWGAWSGAGMVAVNDKINASRLVEMIDHEVGSDVLEYLMLRENGHLAVLPFSVRALIQFYPSNHGLEYFRDLVGERLNDVRSDGGREQLHPRPDLATPYVSPRTDIEMALVAIWERSLKISGIGIQDDIFELGGDSVFANQILSHISDLYGVRPNIEEAFQSFTIEGLATLVERELINAIEKMDEGDVRAMVGEE